MKQFTKWFFTSFIFLGCEGKVDKKSIDKVASDTTIQQDTVSITKKVTTPIIFIKENSPLVISNVNANELVSFAKTLLGTVYKYASIDPAEGFDCSGFITYVFNHFNIAVPRSSVDFTDVGKTIEPFMAKEGDLILFTGTVDSIRVVGHMGIVTENTDSLRFIHSTSGRANGVTISTLNEHYKKRFVKVTRIFKD